MSFLGSYEREREEALWEESLTDGQYMQAAMRQYAYAHGAEHPDHAWIATPYDTWERNPHYTGPTQPHPEDYDYHEAEEDGPRRWQYAVTHVDPNAPTDIPF